MKITGLIPPMVTPLDVQRKLDAAGVRKMVKHLVGGGVDGIFLMGTTGEGPHLSYAVREALVKETCRAVKGRVPVFVGITETDIEDALDLAAACRRFGAAGVVAAPPYYFKLTQTECAAWFTELANRSPLPVVVYNMPAHTDTVVDPTTIVKLAAHKNIVAMKDSASSIPLFNRFLLALEPFKKDFSLLIGPDEGAGEAVALGADGCVSAAANLWPAAFKALYLAAKAGDLVRTARLQRFATMVTYNLYTLGQGQIGFLKGIKAALSDMGLVQNVLSSPFTPFADSELASARKALKALEMEYGRLDL